MTSKVKETITSQRLGEQIGDVLLGLDLLNHNVALLDNIDEERVSQVNMLCSLASDRSL